MLRELAESVYELRESRKAKRKARKDAARKARREAARTGAEEQRALERSAMLAQQAEREAMACEDARAMACEMQERAARILRDARKSELRERAYRAKREAEELALVREDGLCFRFERSATHERWRDSTELFETFDVGCTVRQLAVLSTSELALVPEGLLSGEPLVLPGSQPIKRDVVLAACGDGAVRLVVYSLQRNRTSTGSAFVVGRAPDEVPVLSACLVRSGDLQSKLGWLVLYACGDGFIRCGWDHWKRLFKANIGAPENPASEDPASEEKDDGNDAAAPWEAAMPKLAPVEDAQPDHEDVVYGLLTFERCLFSWSADGSIKRWCLDTGELMHTFSGTRGGVTSCVISSDGKFLLSAGDTSDPRVRLWDAQHDPSQPLARDHQEQGFYDHVCDGCDRVRRVALAEHELLKSVDFQAALYRGRNLAHTVAEQDERHKRALQEARRAASESVTRDAPAFARCHGGALRIFHEHRAHYVGIDGPPSHGEWINGLCLNADDSLAASCGSDTFAKVWRFPEGDLVCRVKSDDWVMNCALGTISDFENRPLEVLVTACADSTITIWDIASGGAALQTLRGHSDAVVDVCFLRNGRFVDRAKREDAELKPTNQEGLVPDDTSAGREPFEEERAPRVPEVDGDQSPEAALLRAVDPHCDLEDDEVCNFVRSSSHDGTIRTWKLGSGLPFAPPPPSVEDAQQTEMTIHWEMPVQNGSPVLSFCIRLRENEIGDFEMAATVDVDTKDNLTTFKRRMTGLHPGSSYEFCVAATSKLGQGPWSQPSEHRRCQPAVPGRVDAPIVTAVTTTTMTIAWVAPDSMGAHIQEFAIRRRGGTSSRTFEESEEVIVAWQGARAKAEEEQNAAVERRRKLESWLHENRHLGAKETLRVRRKLKEEENLENQRRILVQVALSATGSAATRKGITAAQLLDMSATITGLEPGMAYQFSVLAANKIGRGPWSTPSISAVTGMCAPDTVAEAPWLQGTSTSTLTVAWTPPRSNGSVLTAFVLRFGKVTAVDEMLQCEDTEDACAHKARAVLETDEVAAASERIEQAAAAIVSKHVVNFKMAGKVSDSDFHVLRVALYVIMHVSGEDSKEDHGAPGPAETSLAHPLPQRLELNSAVRHPEQFLGRVRSFRLASRDPELGQSLRPALAPLPRAVLELVDGLRAHVDAIKLGLSRVLVSWLETVVTYDREVYASKVYPELERATVAWRRRREILGSELSTQRAGGKVTHVTVENLEAGQAYRFQICAVNDEGTGGFSPASRPFVVKRGPPSAAQNVAALAPGIFSMTVTWDPPLNEFGSEVFANHVSVRAARQGAFVHVKSVPGSQRELEISNLQPDTLYQFAVTVENEQGRGPRSEPSIGVRTLPARVPDAVDAPMVLGADFRAVRLHWRAPAFDGGRPVTRFLVNAFRVDSSEELPMGTCATLEQVGPEGPYVIDVPPGVRSGSEEQGQPEEFFMEDEVEYAFSIIAENLVGMSDTSKRSPPVVIVRPK